jgi:hypothetical protein
VVDKKLKKIIKLKEIEERTVERRSNQSEPWFHIICNYLAISILIGAAQSIILPTHTCMTKNALRTGLPKNGSP